MNDPKVKFDSYVESLQKEKIDDKLELDLVPCYKNIIGSNLEAFRRRLTTVQQILERSDKFKDPCNFFIFKEAGQELEPHFKQNLVTKMSPVLLKVFVEVLEGTFRVGTIRYRLKSL